MKKIGGNFVFFKVEKRKLEIKLQVIFVFFFYKFWKKLFSEQKNIQEFKFLSNKSHLIVNLNIMNIRTKKINSLCLFDLIGFKTGSKPDLKQISLTHLMSFFNEIINNKDDLVKFKKDFEGEEGTEQFVNRTKLNYLFIYF